MAITGGTYRQDEGAGGWSGAARTSGAAVRLSLLGPLEFSGPDGPLDCAGKLGGTLALLACAPGRQLSREKIAATLWGDRDEELAKHNLRQVVLRMRRLPVAGIFAIDDMTLGLVEGRLQCDVWTFNALIRAGSAAALADAVALHRGAFLANVAIREAMWDDWLQGERAGWDQTMVDCCVRLGGMVLESGDADAAIAAAHKAIQIDNYREDAHRLLMKGLAARDRRSEALRHYDKLAAFLENEIDSEPDELTQALAVSLKQESAVRPGTAPGATLDPRSGIDLERVAAQAVGLAGIGVMVAERAGEHDGEGSVIRATCAAAERRGGLVLRRDPSSATLRFPDVRGAAAAGLAILGAAGRVRLGLHVLDPQDDADPGARERGVAVARQLSRLAGPGQMIVSVEAREHMVSSLDVTVRDLGELAAPGANGTIRSFAASDPRPEEPLALAPAASRQPLPVVALIPFATHTSEASLAFLGDILADEMILSLSRSIEVSVISRLSTAALRARSLSPQQIHTLVNANYVASGSCYIVGDRVRLTVEFTDAHRGEVAWVESMTAPVGDALAPGGLVEDVVHRIKATVMQSELARARQAPMAELSNCTLLLGAIAMMHQLSPDRFAVSRQMLDVLIEREPDHPAPRAWLGMFLLLRTSQGWSPDIEADAALAYDSTQRALDMRPDHSLALAVDAHVHTQFKKDFHGAAKRLDLALASNPSNSLAWLFKSMLHAFQGDGAPALMAADSAMRLSPLDPRRWFYDSLAASGALGAGQLDKAILLARRSIEANATHASTYRALAIALSLADRMDEARLVVEQLMQIQPGLTASGYRARHPSGASQLGSLWADALRRAGVPN
jgi:adenylate cyclase